jgi:hypothetical protein
VSKDVTPPDHVDWRLLVGFMTEQQALAYVHTSSMDSPEPDKDWVVRIRNAQNYTSTIAGRGQVEPLVSELAPKYRDHLEAVQANPTFQEQLGGTTSHRFASVELAKLRCFQGALNHDHIERLLRRTPGPHEQDATLEFCLPVKEDNRGAKTLWSSSSSSFSTVMVSENLNLRVAGMAQGEDNVTGRKLTAIVYGFGSPQISVSEYEGKYIIVNGHHRMYSLMKKGHKTAPCLVLTNGDYFYKGPQSLSMIARETVMSDCPPFLGDFDTAAAIRVLRRRSMVVINVHAEAQEVSF